MSVRQVGGKCFCRSGVTGRQCDSCIPGYFNLQVANPMGCEECHCNDAGTVGGDTSCHATLGQCVCKANVRSKSALILCYNYKTLLQLP